MSVKKERTIVVLMRFVITPKDPTTALVNQDMKETEIFLPGVLKTGLPEIAKSSPAHCRQSFKT